MIKLNKEDIINEVKKILIDSIDKKSNVIYNETSLQFILGERLKKGRRGYNVEYERKISYFGLENKTIEMVKKI